MKATLKLLINGMDFYSVGCEVKENHTLSFTLPDVKEEIHHMSIVLKFPSLEM